MDQFHEFINRSHSKMSQKIRIKEQIDIWRRSNRNENPEVLIDLEHFQDVFAQRDQIGALLGGRYQIYNILFERFIKELLRYKVKVKFFSAIHQETDQLGLFIPKMEHEYHRHIELMDRLRSDPKSRINPSVPSTTEYNLISIIEKCCPKDSLHTNYYRHAQEIIQYANAHAGNVLAIISNHLQLLMFDGSFQFWYANDIDLKTLYVTSICRKTLELSLDMNTKQLQLLSVLVGSPYLPSEIIDLHLPGIYTEGINRIEKLAEYIKEKAAMDIEQLLSPENGIINAIENGLNCYDTRFNVATLCEDSFTKFSKQRNPFIYTLIADDVFLIKDIAFIDYRFSGSSNYAELVVPLLQKMLGILFKKSLIRPKDRKICLKFAHDEPYRVVKIPIIFPTLTMPPIFDLIYKNRDTQHDVARWSLLKWIFDLDDEFCKELRKLPNTYIAVVLTIHYLLEERAINISQADAILYCEFEARKRNVDEMPPKILHPHSFQIEGVRTAHLYTKMFVLVNRCLEVCGLNRRTEIIRFDGPHYYVTLQKFTQQNATELDEAVSEMCTLRIYSHD